MNLHQQMRVRGTRLTPAHELITLPALPAWMGDERRACNPAYGRDHLFTSDERKDRTRAARLCRECCPLITECLNRAIEQNQRHYVWGGKDFSASAVQEEGAAQRTPRPAGSRRPPVTRVRPPRDRAALEAQVRQLYEQDLTDGTIALQLGRSARTISAVRRRLHLPPKYGPGGKRFATAVPA